MSLSEQVVSDLCQKIKEREFRPPMTFNDFLSLASENPHLTFRNIFQQFCDMIESYTGSPVDEYANDPESIHYSYYDCTRLLSEDTDRPFFADRLFANRFIKHFYSFRYGIQQNRIYIFEGPHGCGKSTFLNNLLMKFEQYSRTSAGTSYEVVWRLDRRLLDAAGEQCGPFLPARMSGVGEEPIVERGETGREPGSPQAGKDYLEVLCPSHDNPLLVIPKAYRREVFDQLIRDEAFKEKLFSEKQYEWVFKENPCTICSSLYNTLLDRVDSPVRVFDMVFARRYEFNRSLGRGISVFNPGDRLPKNSVKTNHIIQAQLDTLLKDSNRVRYIFSRFANTNNGVYAVMDIKGHNKERFANLHGIVSEGLHKVEEIEENVRSLIVALMNPEDRENIGGTQSFTDRITSIKIPYVLDYNTEAKIYTHFFGEQVERRFLPRVLQNFAKVIISSRLKENSEALLDWIAEPEGYGLYCDRNLQLLKMDIYTGLIPLWLSSEDRRRFTAKRRRAIIGDSETEGDKGFSGRDSLKIFNDFLSTYGKNGKLINMAMVCNYFRSLEAGQAALIPPGFLGSLVKSYNYTVLQEVKEALYYFNEDRISRDIQNYLFASNFEPGRMEKCIYTGEMLEITDEFFQSIEERILGTPVEVHLRLAFRQETQNQYTSKTLTQEMMVEGKEIKETGLYKQLLERYIYNSKEKAIDPFLKNDHFRSAIKDFSTDAFRTYDKRIRQEVTFLMNNLMEKYRYTSSGAKEICIYVIDNELARTFRPEPEP